MKAKLMLAAFAALALSTGAAYAKPPAYVAAAIADKGRPEADTKRDADRKPDEMVAFAGIKPGMKVADFIPGGGYFTRIFAKVVGPKGKVYAVTNPPAPNAANPPPMQALVADPNYANVEWVKANFAELKLPEQVDVLWTSQNYHDLHLKRFNLDVAKVNKQIYDSIKPGGYFIVLDHVGATGSGVEAADKVHRIDPALARQEIEAAGFKFAGESKVLRSDKDDYTKTVFDPSLRGHTDQFIYKFRKPK